jgi:hypothetical protein
LVSGTEEKEASNHRFLCSLLQSKRNRRFGIGLSITASLRRLRVSE